jgi:uncharacterized membrane protein YcaP (DUF421 family)
MGICVAVSTAGLLAESSAHSYVHLVFTAPTWKGAAVIAGKTAVIYAFLVVGLRLLGKRALGQMNIYDLVVIIVLANAVQNAMVGNDTSLACGLVAAMTLLALNRIVTTVLARSPRAERLMVGDPLVLVSNGKVVEGSMRKAGVTEDQIMEALREHELDDLSRVRLAVLETDGTISVVPDEATVHRTRRHYRGLRLT